MASLPGNIVKKIARLCEEEEMDIYVLTLYCMNSSDMKYFNDKDRKKIQNIFNVLTQDTRRHSEILRELSRTQV